MKRLYGTFKNYRHIMIPVCYLAKVIKQNLSNEKHMWLAVQKAVHLLPRQFQKKKKKKASLYHPPQRPSHWRNPSLQWNEFRPSIFFFNHSWPTHSASSAVFVASPSEFSSRFWGVFYHQPLEQGPLSRLDLPSLSVGRSCCWGNLELTPASSHRSTQLRREGRRQPPPGG